MPEPPGDGDVEVFGPGRIALGVLLACLTVAAAYATYRLVDAAGWTFGSVMLVCAASGITAYVAAVAAISLGGEKVDVLTETIFVFAPIALAGVGTGATVALLDLGIERLAAPGDSTVTLGRDLFFGVVFSAAGALFTLLVPPIVLELGLGDEIVDGVPAIGVPAFVIAELAVTGAFVLLAFGASDATPWLLLSAGMSALIAGVASALWILEERHG
jgi:hypothetical protein